MAYFRSFPSDHRRNGRFVETLHDGSRVFLEVGTRNRHPRASELVKLHMNMRTGRAGGYYVEEPQIVMLFEHRQRVDVEVLPQGYRYGRVFERDLRALCERVADILVPARSDADVEEDIRPTGTEPVDETDDAPSPFIR